MSDRDIKSRLDLALSAAREAGDLTLGYFRQGSLAIELKSDATPVTIADRQAEELLRERIANAFPTDGLLGEEYGEQKGTSPYRWILDPIDGTKSFIRGVPLYGTLVGVEFDGRGVIGVAYIPALAECIHAAKGFGAWHTVGSAAPTQTRVSKVDSLAGSLFCTSDVKTFESIGKRAAYDRLMAATSLSRTWGDCYGYLLVATGRAEVMVDPVMSVWDAAALQPIMEEAGGTFTDWSGKPTIHSGEGIATNGIVLEETLRLTAGKPPAA